MEHSHDPFHPTAAYQPPSNATFGEAPDGFREDRWRRAGATDEQIDQLADEHFSRGYDEQVEHNGWLASVSDGELMSTLDDGTEVANPLEAGADDATLADPLLGQAPEVDTSGTVTQVLSEVGSDAEKAKVALEAEQASDKPRVSLINELNKVIGA